eukprot:TRINITY_DN9035_c0_g1_i2.p2 TRINITY_DN9035_c0_g1~~TRINITY_DN9035_c0_g1_i2.p2  ORF type:complete len:151 (-),score=11.73 TRINITY_DN9035_c0_g1_i2:240-692(-)
MRVCAISSASDAAKRARMCTAIAAPTVEVATQAEMNSCHAAQVSKRSLRVACTFVAHRRAATPAVHTRSAHILPATAARPPNMYSWIAAAAPAVHTRSVHILPATAARPPKTLRWIAATSKACSVAMPSVAKFIRSASQPVDAAATLITG